MRKDAIISADGLYRYALWRVWDEQKRTILFICLNPSTADAVQDDPTLRRCMGFARAWGYGGVKLGNLFAYRATNPKELLAAADPVGPENNEWLKTMAVASTMVIAAWGNRGTLLNRSDQIAGLSRHLQNMKCLAVNKSGQPKHPLYVRGDIEPIAFYGAECIKEKEFPDEK